MSAKRSNGRGGLPLCPACGGMLTPEFDGLATTWVCPQERKRHSTHQLLSALRVLGRIAPEEPERQRGPLP
jgi:hypothetical protein